MELQEEALVKWDFIWLYLESLLIFEIEYSDAKYKSKYDDLFLWLESLTMIRYDGNLYNHMVISCTISVKPQLMLKYWLFNCPKTE